MKLYQSTQYMFSLLMYVVNNKHLFAKNLEVHNHNKRSAINFYLPTINLTEYKKRSLLYRNKNF